MPRKVLIFSLAYYPRYVGGAEVALKAVTDRIPQSACEFHLITNRFDSTAPKREVIGNVHVHRVGFGMPGADTARTHAPLFYLAKVLFVPLAAWKGRALVRQERIDLCWAMMTYMVFPIVLMRLSGVRIPYLVTLQEGDPFEHVFKRWYIRPFLPLIRYGFRAAAVIQCISVFLSDWARSLGARGRVVVIPNGVDVVRFAEPPDPGDRARVETELRKMPGEVLLVTTSRLVHKNGIDTVLSALPHLPGHVRFVVVGEGPDRAKLEELARSVGVEDRVCFLGHRDQQELPALLAACDIFVRPSRSEGMGNSFIEAMAAGLPIIATQAGGITDFLFDAERNPDQRTTGWAVNADAPEEIAKAVRTILAEPARTRTVTEHARTVAIERYSWDLIAQQIHAIIKEVR